MHESTGLCCATTDEGECLATSVEGAPVPLCATHLRVTYAFARDLVEDGWREAARAQLATDRSLATSYESQPLDAAPAPRQRHDEECGTVVYFVRFGDRVKIGFTSDMKARMAVIPHDEILATIPGGRELEQKLHHRFKLTRLTGEWFRISPELMHFIGQVRKAA